MSKILSGWLAAAVLATALVAGCSDDPQQKAQAAGGSGGTAGGGGSGGTAGTGGTGGSAGFEMPEGCVPLDLGAERVGLTGIAAYQIQSDATPPLAGAHRTRAAFEMYDWNSDTGQPMPLELGTFDLAATPDDNYGTCQHCTILVAYDDNDQPTRVFFQKSGELQLTKLDENERTIAAATLRGVELREITQKSDLTWEDVPDSDCYWIGDWSFDTTPNNGEPCVRADDCNNTALQVCDPATGLCDDAQCSFTGDYFCPENQICVGQLAETSIGACYFLCDPHGEVQCANGAICVPYGPTQSVGACMKVGEGKLGEPCDPVAINTGCEYGAICTGEPAVCTQLCMYLSDDPGCPDGQVCGADNLCKDPSVGDPAALGENCAPTSAMETGCGADGEAFAGICLSLYPEVQELTCYEMCRTIDPAGCGEGSYCAMLFGNPAYGLCWKNPVCGDGEVDPLNEVCDDGNTMPDDGCAADCAAAEFGPLCEAAPVLTLDETITGTTVGGATGYTGSCRMYQVVPAATYRFTPPGPGTLRLTLASPEANLDLLVLGDCADPTTELGCGSLGESAEELRIDFADASAIPALVVVAGSGIHDAGAFELQAHFVPAVCGDGIVAGPEMCDDGGTASGDGCSADCRTIEWQQLCASLPALSTTAINAGDTSAGDDYQQHPGLCTAFAGDGPDNMYRFTAPNDGTLTLRLAEESVDHVLYVIDGCGPVEEWEDMLSCSNSARPGRGDSEQLQVQLSRNQQVTVVVEGFLPNQRGPYELEAVFQVP